METMIEVKDVSMRFRMANDRINSIKEYAIAKLRGKLQYNEFEALRHVSFDVKKGEVVGLIGHNGAGKSTILKVISGILKPTEGSVIVRGNVAPMLELGSGFDMDMSGRENIFLNGAILGYSEEFLKSKYDEIVAFSEIGQFIDVPLRNYSSGMIARLAFSVATVVVPEVLIVDEVLSVGDAAFHRLSCREGPQGDGLGRDSRRRARRGGPCHELAGNGGWHRRREGRTRGRDVSAREVLS